MSLAGGMDAYPIQAERLLEVGRYAELERLLQTWLGQQPRDADAHQFRARLALARQDYAGCVTAAQEALALSPDDPTTRYVLHFAHFNLNQYADAESVILALIREQPGNPHFLAAYARLMLCTLQLDKARALVAEALRIAPDHADARLVSVLLRVTENRTHVAAAELGEVIAASTGGVQTAFVLVQVLVAQRRLREALLIGQELLREDPTNAELIALVIRLRAHTHWLALPAYPQLRWGWPAVVAAWVLAAFGLPVLLRASLFWGTVALIGYLVWLLHSWTHHAILSWWIRARGV